MREPRFWWRKPGLRSALLTPIALGYGAIAARRMSKHGADCGLPVICVGNFTLGGTGKTPAAIMLAAMLRTAGETPFFLTRGYGGSIAGPHLVDLDRDSAAAVGDEALLLARAGSTVVGRDRARSAQLAKAEGASVIIMDDGLQNSSLAKDMTIAVVDGRRGIGNACVFPAGPLRAPMAAQLARTDALLAVGDKAAARDVVTMAGARPVFHARLTPDEQAVTALRGRKVFAFAGIGDPEKFFRTIEDAGIEIARRRAFADHHRFGAEEAAELVMAAEHETLTLLTTAKDHARMTGDPALAALAARAQVLPVTMQVDETEAWRDLVSAALKR